MVWDGASLAISAGQAGYRKALTWSSWSSDSFPGVLGLWLPCGAYRMPTNPNWTDWEDQELRRLVEEHGPKKWSLIASKLKTKGSKQCRRRWKNYLNADLKQGGWSVEEDRILLDGHKRYGNKWTEIAKMVGGRTDNAVKNRWAALCKRNQRTGGARAAPGGGGGRGRKARHSDGSDSEEDSDRSSTPPPRQAARSLARGPNNQNGNHMLRQPPAMALAAEAVAKSTLLGKRHQSSQQGEEPMMAKRQQMMMMVGQGAVQGSGRPALDLRSPRGRPDGTGRLTGGLSSPRAGMREHSPAYTSSHRSRASGSSHLTSVSPPGRKLKPELTLLIPNAAADPPPNAAAQGGLEIHVMKDLLSPAEVRYARELNDMEIPLQIALEDPLEPPLSTSRRAAQDALSALVAGSPTGGGLGPLSLYGAGEYGQGGPSSTTSNGSDLNELLRWFQQNFTPRSTRQQMTGPSGGAHNALNFTSRGGRPGGAGDAWASPTNVLHLGAAAQSPKPLTRSAARLATPRGQDGGGSGWEGLQGRTPQSGGSGAGTGSAEPGTGSQQGVNGVNGADLHDGHRQLLSKLLTQARTGMEEPQPPSVHSSPPLNGKQQQTITAIGTSSLPRVSPRFAHTANGRSPKPWETSSRAPSNPPQALTGAQAAAAINSLPMPGALPLSTTSKRTRHGNAISNFGMPSTRGHPGPSGALALSSLGGLLSPGMGMGLGPLSSGRGAGGNAWASLDVVLTPAISQGDINALLELLTGDE